MVEERGDVGDAFMGVLAPKLMGAYCADFRYACW